MIEPLAPPSNSGDERADLVDEMIARWSASRPFIFLGSLCTVAGGLVAAMTRPTGFVLGSWTAAFLVLVGGVAQIALGAGQGWLAHQAPLIGRVRAEAAFWNLGVGATIVGTLTGMPIVTTVAGFVPVGFVVVPVRPAVRPQRGGSSP